MPRHTSLVSFPRARALGVTAVLLACLMAAPAAQASGSGVPVSATEGAGVSSTVATFNHATLTSATIDWGDGTTSSPGTRNGSTVSGTHTFAEEGTYTVTVTVTYFDPNNCGQGTCHDSATTTARVADARLSGTGVPVAATAGTEFSGPVASFTDADPGGVASDYAATIDWGDGSSSAGAISGSTGGFTVAGSHTYAAGTATSHPVTVTIRDAGGASTVTAGTATASAPPTFTVSKMQAVAGELIRFDATTAPAARGAVRFGWDFSGTGTPQAQCGTGTPVVYHAFGRGVHTVSLFVTGATGTTTRYDETITVTAPAGSPAHGRVRIDGFHLPDAMITPPTGGPSATIIHARSPAIAFCEQLEPPPSATCADRQNAVQFGLFDAVADPAWCEQDRPGPRGSTKHVWTARPGQVVRVNGLDLIPDGRTAITLDPAANRLSTVGGSGIVDVVLHAPPEFGGDLDLGSSRLDWRPRPDASAYPLPDFPLPTDSLLGFALDGTASAQLVPNASAVTVHLQLPSEFELPGGGTITSDVTIGADNADGARLDGLDVEVADLFLGALEVRDFGVSYQRDGDLWQGHGSLVLPSGTAISAEPPAPYGFGLRDGGLAYAGARADFEPGVPLVGGLTLNSIGAAVSTHPTYFRGDVGLRWLELVHVDGSLQLVFASPDEPLHLSTSYGAGVTTTTALLVSGDLSLHTPLGDADIAHGYINWFAPSYVEFGGDIAYDFFPHFDIVGVDAGFHANADLSTGKFDIEGGAHVCVIDHTLCGGGDFVLSSHGAGGCLRTFLGDYGGDYEYDGSWHVMFFSCDASAAREVVGYPTATDAAAHIGPGERTVRIGPGLTAAIIGVKGRGGAPYVTLTGPHGESVATPDPRGAINDRRWVVARSPTAEETFFVIGHPTPGIWRLTPMSGSVPITGVEQGSRLPAPSVRASVSGHARAFALHYLIRAISGQTVQFAEQGRHEYRVLGVARGASGTLRFAPGIGPAGRRRITAKVFSYGHLRQVLAVATYRAPGPPVPPMPRGVRVRRAGSTLLISWSRTPGASRFAVAVALRDGRHLGYVLVRGRRTVRITRFTGSDTAVVRVMALAADNHAGPRVTIRLGSRRPGRHR